MFTPVQCHCLISTIYGSIARMVLHWGLNRTRVHIPITSARLCLITFDSVLFVILLPQQHKINLAIYCTGRKMMNINGSFSVNITVSSVNCAVQTFAAKCMPCVEVMSDHQ